MNAPDDRDEDITPAEITGYQRALAALPPAHRAMVTRMARMILRAAESPRVPRRPRLAPVEPIELDPEADDLTRAAARRILAGHGRGTGGAA